MADLAHRELARIYGQGGRVHKPGRDTLSHDLLSEGSTLGSPDFREKEEEFARRISNRGKTVQAV
jgi:hypothetical protein